MPKGRVRIPKIEAYVRPGSTHNMLNIYVPAELRAQFLQDLANGTCSVPVNFEISVLPEWLTDDAARVLVRTSDPNMHVRVPPNAINVSFTDGD